MVQIQSNKGEAASFRVTFVGQSCHPYFQKADNTSVIWPLLLLTFWPPFVAVFLCVWNQERFNFLIFLFYPLLAQRLFCVWNLKRFNFLIFYSFRCLQRGSPLQTELEDSDKRSKDFQLLVILNKKVENIEYCKLS